MNASLGSTADFNCSILHTESRAQTRMGHNNWDGDVLRNDCGNRHRLDVHRTRGAQHPHEPCLHRACNRHLKRFDGIRSISGQGHARRGNISRKGDRVAWAQVQSTPVGAEIWVDGVATGQKTPARVEISSGIRNITLKLDGYRNFRSAVEASDGGTVSISPNMIKVR